MPDLNTVTPDVNYLTRANIVHPRSEGKSTEGLAEVTAGDVRARAELATRLNVTSVTGGASVRHP